MEEEGNYVVFKEKSIEAVTDQDQDAQSIEGKLKEIDDSSTDTFTVDITTSVFDSAYTK